MCPGNISQGFNLLGGGEVGGQCVGGTTQTPQNQPKTFPCVPSEPPKLLFATTVPC